MENKSKITTTSATALLGYGLLKLPQNKIDPYTRFTFGVAVGSAMVFSQNPLVRYAGIGLGIASFLQLIDIKNGGRLSSNEAVSKVFVLHEEKGVVELNDNEVPDYNIDGFTFKGLNGVFKLSDGVYAGINFNNDINTFGVGSIVNKLRNAGLKSKNWVDAQTDKRWSNLYDMSIDRSLNDRLNIMKQTEAPLVKREYV